MKSTNVLIIKVSILINKDVFEPSYTALKFRVLNCNYICTNLIPYTHTWINPIDPSGVRADGRLWIAGPGSPVTSSVRVVWTPSEQHILGNSLGVHWLGLHTFTAESVGSVPWVYRSKIKSQFFFCLYIYLRLPMGFVSLHRAMVSLVAVLRP